MSEKTTETKVNWRPVRVLSQDVIVLLDRLQLGETVAYRDLSSIVGTCVRTVARSKLQTAMNKALELGIVCHCVTNVGVKRLTDEETVRTTPSFLKKVRRAARKQSKRLASVEYETLTKEAQSQHNAGLAMLGTIVAFTEKKQMEAVVSKVASTGGTLSIGQTMDLFRGNKKQS